eukprot:5103002-Pyramimonas_sp.AAC.1
MPPRLLWRLLSGAGCCDKCHPIDDADIMLWVFAAQVGDAGYKYDEPSEIPELLEKMEANYLELQVLPSE